MNMMQSEISQQPSSEVAPSNQGSWLALLTVAVTAFALVTSEFLPIGVLNSISTDLHVSVGTAGLMITLPGIMAALAAPLLPVLVKKFRSTLFATRPCCNHGYYQCHYCNCTEF